MSLQDIVILIPSHSLEDFPTEQTDKPAASLLNCFAAAWHPELLAWTGALPRWRRADEPTAVHSAQLYFVPTVCDGWLPHNWIGDTRAAGSTVVAELDDRTAIVEAALAALPERYDVAPDLVADFFSLGFCWLQTELLTRHMRNFGNIDDARLQQRAVAAAKAALDNDRETAEVHLKGCFEILLEARERFYPVDCYLLDITLVMSDSAADVLIGQLNRDIPWSLLAPASDLGELCPKSPEVLSALRSASEAGRVRVIGGEERETPLTLLPLESALHQFALGTERLEKLTGRAPLVWGRRRFGLTSLMPQLLSKRGYKGALHVVLDDGIYPDAEHTKLRWRGADETVIDALSRIPLAADSASSYLRFPVRMAESMDNDQVAGLVFARWPDVSSPFFEDLRRSQKYAPALGRFVTLDDFFERTELPGQLNTPQAHEYFAPFLIQSVARREADPISRFAAHALRRRRFDTAQWCASVAKVLVGQPAEVFDDQSVVAGQTERALEAGAPDSTAASITAAEEALTILEREGPAALSRLIMHGAADGKASSGRRGFLLFNSLSFTRRACVPLPGLKSAPAVTGPIKAVQFDPAKPEQSVVVVELPGHGYVWVPEDERATTTTSAKPYKNLPMVESGVLRNEWFEVAIHEQTGGIAHIRMHDQRNKRLSQQLSFRFPRERTFGEGDATTKSQYAEMRAQGPATIVSSGPVRGELATTGQIIDQTNGQPLAGFRQVVRVWRARPLVEIDIELTDLKLPDGDPWNNYFASRFAWNDSTAAVTRSVFHTAQGFGSERIETSDYIEVASETERLTIVPHGLPYHRKTGLRMVDSLLAVAGESQRQFRFTITVDTPFPLEAAWNATTPVPVVPTEHGPPRSGSSGWLFHLSARNIQLTRVLNLSQQASPTDTTTSDVEAEAVPAGRGFAVRLIETEGQSKRVALRTFRQPLHARKRNLIGQPLQELTLEGDAALIDMSPYEVTEVELRFGD